LGPGAAAPEAQPVFRATTDLVALQVTVVDAHQRYVTELGRDDFQILEEGRPQSVDLFAAGTAPLDLFLLIDISGSMVDCLPTVRRAASNLLRTLGVNDRAEIIVFNERVRIAQELTGDRDALVASLQQLQTRGSTSLYDALYVALKRMARLPAQDGAVRRQAVVMLTDGDDTTSHVTIADVQNETRDGNAMIYAIVPPEIGARHRDRVGTTPASLYYLRAIADETGGRSFTPLRLEDLITVYGEIANEFRHQYWLAYVPPAAAAGFRRVAVRIPGKPEFRARTRAGYVAGAPR
jgi:Ca-activated chloride channel family protein